MDYLWNSLQCWWRDKEVQNIKPPTETPIKKTLEEVCCSHCFIFLENENFFKKKAKINKHKFGFCSMECYKLWLKNPSTMLIGKLN